MKWLAIVLVLLAASPAMAEPPSDELAHACGHQAFEKAGELERLLRQEGFSVGGEFFNRLYEDLFERCMNENGFKFIARLPFCVTLRSFAVPNCYEPVVR